MDINYLKNLESIEEKRNYLKINGLDEGAIDSFLTNLQLTDTSNILHNDETEEIVITDHVAENTSESSQ